jgi:septum site-determining protein MinC
MGSIGPGAEVIADNNIHIYGPLRGRALCGVSGNTSARIFCQSLQAELVSVAGNYRMLETIPEELRGKPAQVWLENDKLNIEPL